VTSAAAATAEKAPAFDAGSALNLANRIMSEGRDPTEDEATRIRAAIVSLDAPFREAFLPWRRYEELRGQMAHARAEQEVQRKQREELRQRWLSRPERWRALPEPLRFAVALASQFADGINDTRPVTVAEVHQGCMRVANDILRPDEASVPWTFEQELCHEARLAGLVRRDGLQKANE
jgi:hypothetical protein